MSLTAEQQLANLDRISTNATRIGESNHYGLKASAALVLAGSVLIVACGSDDNDSKPAPTTVTVAEQASTTEDSTTTEAPTTVAEVVVEETSTTEAPTTVAESEEDETVDAVVVTDESLQARSMTCGGKYDQGVSMLDLSYKYDYFKENVEMGKSLIDITSTNTEFGMGQDAFDYVLDNSYFNPATIENINDRTSGSEETDTFINNIHTAVLNETHTFINGDCRNDAEKVTMPSSDIPYITLNKGETVEGFVIPADKLQDLLKVMKNQEKFLFLEGSLTDADGNEVKTVFITLFANGCDNPIRIEVKVPVPPTETVPTTTVPGKETPTTTIAPPTTTVPPTTTTPTTTVPPTTSTTTTTIPNTTTTTTTTTTIPNTTTTTTQPGRKVPTTTIAPPPTTNPAEHPTTTLWAPPSTAAPDTLPPGVTPTTWDSVPTPSTIQDPEQPPVTALPPTTVAPPATTPATTPVNGTVPTR